MGISSDDVIHLAFDHHVSTLHYRCSQPGIANDPTKFTWSEEMFGTVQDNLGGLSIETLCADSHFVVDRQRWQHDKVISVIGQNGTMVNVFNFSIETL